MLRELSKTAAGGLWLGTLLVACQANPDDITVPADSFAAVGTIAHATMRDDGYVDLTLEDSVLEPPSQSNPDTLRVLVTDRTPIFKEDGDGSLVVAVAEDLTVGSRVRAYYSGIMWRAGPAGFVASRVDILRPI